MSWFTHLKGFEIGASCQEMRGVYGIRIIRSKSEVYDHIPTCVWMVAVTAAAVVGMIEVVVGNVVPLEDNHGRGRKHPSTILSVH